MGWHPGLVLAVCVLEGWRLVCPFVVSSLRWNPLEQVVRPK